MVLSQTTWGTEYLEQGVHGNGSFPFPHSGRCLFSLSSSRMQSGLNVCVCPSVHLSVRSLESSTGPFSCSLHRAERGLCLGAFSSKVAPSGVPCSYLQRRKELQTLCLHHPFPADDPTVSVVGCCHGHAGGAQRLGGQDPGGHAERGRPGESLEASMGWANVIPESGLEP